MSNTANLSPLKQAFLALEETQAKLDAVQRARTEPIAVIGVGCRFPGADGPAAFWNNLRAGVDAIREVPLDRWDAAALYDADPAAPGKTYTRWGGFLDRVDQFDPQFFGIAPREAASMEPQQRLLLEVAWEALENAGQAPGALSGTLTGVFIGIASSDYVNLQIKQNDLARLDAYYASGIAHSIASGRLSYVLGLQGPSLSVDTACSSSLVAVHLACQGLRNGECNMALAGGAKAILSPENTVSFSKSHMLSPDGRCKTFDASANGFVEGEGCGIVVLKRLSDAQADGDRILALIRGSAVNQDGPSSGLTAPNGPSQEAVIRAALANGGVKPCDVSYVEAHGTGTSLGDPIEVRALGHVLKEGRPPDQPFYLGSVKTNIGHLEAAAGVAGLIKVVLALQHREIPPHLHLQTPNPFIPWSEVPAVVPSNPVAWPAIDGRRIAGLSSFGFSGTNAHLVIEEAPEPAALQPATDALVRPLHILCLSAKSESALKDLAARYAEVLTGESAGSLPDVCFSANAGRAHFSQRLALTAGTVAEAREQLRDFIAGRSPAHLISGAAQSADKPKFAFLYTGQGAQYAGMGRKLYETQPVFRAALDRCDELLRPHLDRPLLSVLYPAAGGEPSPIDETAYTQPALFALEYALTELWRSWGIRPSALMGHSVGEYVAAHVAGVFSLADALKLIAARGRLMQALPRDGEMAAVFADEATVALAVEPSAAAVSIAAVNGPDSVVISGERAGVQAVLDRLQAGGIKARRLNVSHAFHSPLIEPMLDSFERVAKEVAYAAPQLRLISNVTGRPVGAEVAQPGYWRRHARAAVQFASSVAALHESGYRIFLEIGPNPVLVGMGRRCLPDEPGTWLPSLRAGQDDWQQVLDSLAMLYAQGADVDWAGFDRPYRRKHVALPTYPFQRERYWVDLSPATEARKSGTDRASEPGVDGSHPLLGRRLRSALQPSQFESRLNTTTHAYLNDHRLFGQAVLPGAAYAEMALAAGRVASGAAADGLEDFVINDALFAADGQDRICQLILDPEESGTASFRILSQRDDESWQLHASGRVRGPGNGSGQESGLRSGLRDGSQAVAQSLADIQSRCSEQWPGEDLYKRLDSFGFAFGPSLRAIQRVWRRPEGGEALAEIRLPEPHSAAEGVYRLDPALLDTCLQLVAAALPGDHDTCMPIHMEDLTLHGELGNDRLWSHTTLHLPEAHGSGSGAADGRSTPVLAGDLQLLDDAGRVLVEVRNLRLKRVDRDSLARSMPRQRDDAHADWLYEMQWRPRPLVAPRLGSTAPEPETAGPGTASRGAWLVFTDSRGAGRTLAAALEARGEACLIVSSGQCYEHASLRQWRIDPSGPEQYGRLVSEAFGAEPCRGVIHLWSLDIPALGEGDAAAPATERAQDNQVLGSGSALYLAQALLKAEWPSQSLPQLWLVTRNAQQVAQSPLPVAVAQSPVWGVGSTLALEHPELRCAQVDLDPIVMPGETEQLLAELDADDHEGRVAFRQGTRHVARLEHAIAGSRSEQPHGQPGAEQSARLVNLAPGTLDGLALQSEPRREPGPGEVEIQVIASGLNFRDVMNALAMRDDPEPLGSECSGRIARVGAGVVEFKAGDEVVAIAPGSFGAFATTRAELVAPKPAGLSFAEAATLPLAFLTAHYALNYVARINSSDRVLIHAASGGVGLAAVQLAQRAGAEVFATAGSPAKRAYLESLGVRHVMNSRTLDFADEIRVADAGGVTVVLNSLAGDFIARSMEALAEDGRFLEIGKRDIWSPQQVAAIRPRATYAAIDLSAIVANDPALTRRMLLEVLALVREGALKPLPMQTFALADAASAFRFMAQARHIGKIVLTQPVLTGYEVESAAPGSSRMLTPVTPDGTYLITGGLGGLGLRVARWLVEQGARSLVLVGRSIASPGARGVIDELERAGARVVVEQADVSDAQQVARVLAAIRHGLPPLRGIVHAAAVLDDGAVMQQNWDRFRAVLAPKMDGAWHLHTMTRETALDFFVLFSSVASLLGAPGQANYAAANTFLDALAQYRHAHGLPALSINWGAWSQVGIAVSHRVAERAGARGIGAIEPEQGTTMLGRLLGWSTAQVAVLPFQWSEFLQHYASGTRPALVSDLAGSARHSTAGAPASPAGGPQSEWLPRLADAPAGRRRSVALAFVLEQAARVLGIPASRLREQTPLSEMGLDSLMAVELRNRLGTGLGLKKPLPATLVFEYPSIGALADYLSSEVLPRILSEAGGATAAEGEQGARGSEAGRPGPRKPEGEVITTALETVADLSDEEVDRLFEARMKGRMSS